MCGIVGYIGNRNATPIIIEGIKRLEYRGYDSSGISIIDKNNNLKIHKKQGKIIELERSLPAPDEISGTIGIAHTRWATHGEPNEINAHPHTNSQGSIALVHNGIIENYKNLKETINNFSKHLKEGGVLIIEPWVHSGEFKHNSIHMEVYSGKDIKLARAGYSRKRGNISIVYMEYLVVEKNKGIRHFKEKHEMGLFGVNQTLKIMKDVGLKSIFLKRGLTSGRGLYIGVKVRE